MQQVNKNETKYCCGPWSVLCASLFAFKGLESVSLAEKGGVAKWYYDNIMRNQSS